MAKDTGGSDKERLDGLVSHIEIHSGDTKRSSEFYSKVFGWVCNEFELDGKPYMGWKPADSNGVTGGFSDLPADQRPATVNYVKTYDLDGVIRKIKLRGGRIVMKKKHIPAIGWIARFIDPFGNLLGLFEPE